MSNACVLPRSLRIFFHHFCAACPIAPHSHGLRFPQSETLCLGELSLDSPAPTQNGESLWEHTFPGWSLTSNWWKWERETLVPWPWSGNLRGLIYRVLSKSNPRWDFMTAHFPGFLPSLPSAPHPRLAWFPLRISLQTLTHRSESLPWDVHALTFTPHHHGNQGKRGMNSVRASWWRLSSYER